MYGKDFDKLVDELIDVRDHYADVAHILGVSVPIVDGVPVVDHERVIARAKELASFARAA